jgi:hypothetical protein
MKILYTIIILAFFSCNSTEKHIKSVVENVESERLADEKIEELKIDSIKYSTTSMATILLKQEAEYFNNKVEDFKNKTAVPYLVTYKRETKTFDSLYQHSDTAQNIYEVNYKLVAKTSKNTYDVNRVAYLSIPDLKDVQINFKRYFK